MDITTWAQEYHRQLTQFYIYKRKLKLYHAKRKPFINNTQKRHRLLWAPSSSETETCAVVSRVHISNFRFWKSWPSCPPGRPHCYQCKVEELASVMVWGRVSAHGLGNLHIFEGTTNAERHIQALEQHMLPSKRCLLQGHPCFFQQDHAKPHSACVTAAWLRSERAA